MTAINQVKSQKKSHLKQKTARGLQLTLSGVTFRPNSLAQVRGAVGTSLGAAEVHVTASLVKSLTGVCLTVKSLTVVRPLVKSLTVVRLLEVIVTAETAKTAETAEIDAGTETVTRTEIETRTEKKNETEETEAVTETGGVTLTFVALTGVEVTAEKSPEEMPPVADGTSPARGTKTPSHRHRVLPSRLLLYE